MNSKINNDLLKKYAEDKCNAEEKLVVQQWYNEYSEEKSPKTLEESEIAVAHDDIWASINQAINQPKRFNYTFFKVAAAILLTAGLGYGVYQIEQKTSIIATNVSPNFVAGKVKAEIYTASNRKIVDINSNVSEISSAFSDGESVTISTAIGEEYHADLPDGSEIWLNSNTEVVIQGDFNKSYRDLNLKKGEAYFKVAKDKTKPFRVFVADTKIEALGTEFNVSCYAESKKIKAFLVEGSISVSKKNEKSLVEPNQLYETNDLSGKSSISKIQNPITQYAWKEGYFEYANTPLPEIVAELSRWYNFQFTIHPDYKHKTLTGKITKKQPFSEVLAILEFSGINYKKEEATLILAP